MDHCFLFSKHLDESSCLCLKISQKGELLSPPAQRSFAEIKTLQQGCTTVVLESATSATLFELELPWLPERKARIAIPYALEDKLTQPVEELHFAFDKQRYRNHRYLITVISKQRIRSLMQALTQQDILFDAITLDWFALSMDELSVNEDILLINKEDFKGALWGELAQTYIKKNPSNRVLLFQDSKLDFENSQPKSQSDSYTWLAEKSRTTQIMNLCQGEMSHKNTALWIQRGAQLAGTLGVIWLLSILLVNALSLHFLNKKIHKIDQQIALTYHHFFPQAKQVINPKIRINQLLNETDQTKNHFWFLLNQFAKAIRKNKVTIEEILYQNQILSTKLISRDFSSLEQLENQLKRLHLKVKQTQASTQEKQVVATLELM